MVLKELNNSKWLILDFFTHDVIDVIVGDKRHPEVQYQTIVSRKIFTDESACLVCTYLVIVLTALLLLLVTPLSSSPLLSPDFASVCISLAVSAARNDNILLSDNCYHALSWNKKLKWRQNLKFHNATWINFADDLNRNNFYVLLFKKKKLLIHNFFLLSRETIKLFRNSISFQCQEDNPYCCFA